MNFFTLLHLSRSYLPFNIYFTFLVVKLKFG